MNRKYTNLEMLVIGIKEIAENHKLECDTDWECGEVCIWQDITKGTMTIPAIADVKMLCEELMINPSDIESSEFGVDVWISQEWIDGWSQKTYLTMGQFWRKYDKVESK